MRGWTRARASESVNSLYVIQNRAFFESVRFTNPVKMNRSAFGKIGPEVILDDERVTRKHLKIYWMLASAVPRGKDECWIGQRLISKHVRQSQPTVNRKIKDLERWGHVEILAGANGARSHYRLTSIAFQVKPKDRPAYKLAAKKQVMTVRASARALVDTATARDQILA